jgi:AraC-like DNA-binding protein
MPVTIVRDIGPHPIGHAPTLERPVRVRARDMEPDVLLKRHQHDWGQVTFAISGVCRVTAGDGTWIVPPQRAIWIPPHVDHEVTSIERALLFPLCVLAERAPFTGNECKVLDVSPLLRELLLALSQCDELRREHLIASLILDELAVSATRAIHVPLPRDKRLRSLCEALVADPADSRTLAEWASEVGASERTLARLFESELGMGFGAWRQQARLAHAAPLIARGMPLSVVASTLGYSSQSAFSTMFKKTFGSSPTSFFGTNKT